MVIIGLISTDLVNPVRDANNLKEVVDVIVDSVVIGVKDKTYEDLKTFIFENLRELPLKFMSSVEKLIRHLYDNNIPMAIATNGCHKDLCGIAQAMGLDLGLFSVMVCGADDPDLAKNIETGHRLQA